MYILNLIDGLENDYEHQLLMIDCTLLCISVKESIHLVVNNECPLGTTAPVDRYKDRILTSLLIIPSENRLNTVKALLKFGSDR